MAAMGGQALGAAAADLFARLHDVATRAMRGAKPRDTIDEVLAELAAHRDGRGAVVHLEAHGVLLPYAGAPAEGALWRAVAPGEGAIGTAFLEERPVVGALPDGSGGVAVPLHGRRRPSGTLAVAVEDVVDLVAVVDLAGILLATSLATLGRERRAKETRRQLAALIERAARMGSAPDVVPAVQSLIEEGARLLRCSHLVAFERADERVIPMAGHGVDIDLLRGHPMPHSDLGIELRPDAGARTIDVANDPDVPALVALLPADVLVVTPIALGEHVVGALAVGWRADDTGDDADVLVVEALADLIAVGLVGSHDASGPVSGAEVVQQLRADFISTLSHELRTPLAVIKGAVETLQAHDAQIDPSLRARLLERIRHRVDQEVELVDSLLSLSRLDRGTVRLDLQPFDLADVCRQVAVDHMEASARAVTVRGLDEAPIVADRVAVRQVISNLVGNAIKFSEGAVELSITRLPEAWRVDVDDDGEGIPAAVRSRVFDRFFQVGASSRRRGGVGVGLAVVRGFVELHGGRVGVDASPLGGARFWCELPDALR